MPRKKIEAPSYRYHVSGQAVVTFDGKNYYLGPHDSPESKARYYALLNQYHANGMAMPQETAQGNQPITIRVLAAEYLEHARQRYANNPAERNRTEGICKLLELEYGDLPADDFGPRRLSQLRDLFVASGNSRRYVNRQVRLIKRLFRHSVSQELVDVNVLIRLNTLEPLREGQTSAPELEPVQPVDLEDVRKTVEHLSPILVAMVRIQIATGMRPSEVCNIRPQDIEKRPDGVWIYRPPKHKTKSKGKLKAVPILGDAQNALQPYMNREPDQYCFSPKAAMEWFQDQKVRKTPLSCGNRVGTNRKQRPKKQPGEKYTAHSYRQSIQRAASKAKVKKWFPYQLRHLAATEVREALGVESAQALLGHSRADMTQHYAKVSETKAIAAARVAPTISLSERPETSAS